ncbi:MAG: cadherin-like beta sandwich domain-containing protein [Bacillota bacterium]|nr:cadherin-like beta sandwich domain-containing protein [Bacillota bacterium]
MFQSKQYYEKKVNCFIGNNSGLTLIELLIVMVLLVIVLFMGFTFYSYGILTFRYGEKQADIQQNARIVTEFISNSVRTAERVIIIDEYDGEIKELDVSDFPGLEIEQPGEGFYVYFIFLRDGMIYYQEVDGSGQPAVLLEDISTNLDFDLQFFKGEKDNILSYDLYTAEKSSGRNYSLTTEVLVLNVNKIEDMSVNGGTAIIYQVPAPYPGIRNITVTPQMHSFDGSGGQVVNVVVRTTEVVDGKDVIVEFWKLGKENLYEPTEITNVNIIPIEPSGSDPTIENNKTELNINLPTGSGELYFGDYYIHIEVDSVPLPQRRLYYILPVIEYMNLNLLQGTNHEIEVEIKTKGVPAGTKVSICNIVNPECDDLFVALVEKNNSFPDSYNFLDFTIDNPTEPNVDGNGTVTFIIYPTNPEMFIGKDIYVIAKIGRHEWWETKIVENNNANLGELKVTDSSFGQIILTPEFNTDILEYTVSVSQEIGEIVIAAEIENPNSHLIINGEETLSGVENTIILDEVGTITTVNLTVTAEDLITTKTYIIEVYRAN